MDPDSLELYERVRFDIIIFQALRVTETIFIEYRDGMISAEMWEAQWRALMKILNTKGARQS